MMEFCRFHDDDYEACEKYSGQTTCEAEMKVQEYLRVHGVESLREELGIIVKEYEDLLVLNYNQIESPKTHPIVMECRGLILDRGFNVVSRSFGRFFNLGEAPETQAHLDWSKAVCHEKVDGSLIKIYHFQDEWYVSTRGTAFAESACNFGETFYALVLKSLGLKYDEEFKYLCERYLDTEWTYIFELTSVENRVVKRYEGYTLHYLAARHNETGEYGDAYEFDAAMALGADPVKLFHFSSMEDCVETAKHLPDLEEGYVVFMDGQPVCKVKSPAYVAAHRLRGNGLNPKSIMQLVLMGEQSEYLSIFPEDESFFVPYTEALESLLEDMKETFSVSNSQESQKDFALSVKDKIYSPVLFQARKNSSSIVDTFHNQTESHKLKILDEYAKRAA